MRLAPAPSRMGMGTGILTDASGTIRNHFEESQRDSALEPKVARTRATLGPALIETPTATRLRKEMVTRKKFAQPRCGWKSFARLTQGSLADARQPWAIERNPFGIVEEPGH